jgi:hypothetical protein
VSVGEYDFLTVDAYARDGAAGVPVIDLARPCIFLE